MNKIIIHTFAAVAIKLKDPQERAARPVPFDSGIRKYSLLLSIPTQKYIWRRRKKLNCFTSLTILFYIRKLFKKIPYFCWLLMVDIRTSDIFYKIQNFLRTSIASIITTTFINFLIARLFQDNPLSRLAVGKEKLEIYLCPAQS